MKKFAKDFIMPSTLDCLQFLNRDTEICIRLLEKSPEKFEEIFSSTIVDVCQFKREIYAASDLALICVFEKKFPTQKLNCRVYKKFNSRIECIDFRNVLLAKQMLFSGQPRLFVKADEQLLTTKNLSKRSYGTILGCNPSVLKEHNLDPALEVYDTSETELFF